MTFPITIRTSTRHVFLHLFFFSFFIFFMQVLAEFETNGPTQKLVEMWGKIFRG